MAESGVYKIPQELQEILLDFTVQFLVEQPEDLVSFAIVYFSRLQARRPVQDGHHSDESMLSDEDYEDNNSYTATGRRKSVFAETYNPEEDEVEEKTIVHPKSDAQRRSLMDAVKGILLFRSLESEQLGEVLDAMFCRTVEKDDYIIQQGDDGDNFYVIESGQFNITVDCGNGEKLVGSYNNEGSFGELALMYNMPRAATIKALTAGTLWALDRVTFRRIVLRTAFQRRKMYESLLETVPLLNSLSAYERMNLADALISQTYSDNYVIVSQGAIGDGMYFVEEGMVVISMEGKDGIEREITRIRKRGYFGELALVTHKPRAATARAVGNVRVAFLDVNAFERLLGPCMDVMKRNFKDYEDQLVRIFGSRANMTGIK